ncbi:unnamed protein product [Musa acuminata subsp. malaccensis]|nr:unnamed protein product [Musa acuminata subsp. malaccensis]
MWFSVHEAFILMLLKKMFQEQGLLTRQFGCLQGNPIRSSKACSYHHKDFKCKSWTFGMRKALKLVINYLKR